MSINVYVSYNHISSSTQLQVGITHESLKKKYIRVMISISPSYHQQSSGTNGTMAKTKAMSNVSNMQRRRLVITCEKAEVKED
jgi:hypothetical protein